MLLGGVKMLSSRCRRRQVSVLRGLAFVAIVLTSAVGPFPGCSVDALLPDPIGTDSDPVSLGETIGQSDVSGDGHQNQTPAGVDGSAHTLSIGAGRGFCCNPLTVEFQANLSPSDEQGPIDFRWDFGDSHAATGGLVQHTYTFSGQYDVTLEGRFPDGTAVIVAESYRVDQTGLARVDDAATPPGSEDDIAMTIVADAGVDQVVLAGSTVTLDASETQVSAFHPLTYLWTQVDGSTIRLERRDAVVTSFVAPADLPRDETVTFSLIVSAGEVTDRDTVSITLLAQSPGAGDEPPDEGGPIVVPDDEEQILAELAELPPLQKVHYSWPIPPRLYGDPTPPLLFEYVRLTHACTIAGESPREHHVDNAVRVCKQVNDLNPTIPATIAIQFLPWETVFPADSPPTDFGSWHDAEIAKFLDSLTQLRQWLDAANEQYGTQVAVSALIFDSERFLLKEAYEPGAAAWNAAMVAKYDAFYTVGKSIFPAARIEWYGRGAIQACDDISRWCPSQWFNIEEMGQSFNCALYYPDNTQLLIDTYRQTHENAVAHGVDSIMLWVSLGASWDENRHWRFQWNYDTADSWAIGAQINDPFYGDRPNQYAPWHDAPFVCFYPRPFNDATPHWGRHFVAYVKGAHGIVD